MCVLILSHILCYVKHFEHILCYIFFMENFAEKLKELRIEKKLTCKAVADAVGLTRNAITNYELGIREPSLTVLKALCDFYDVTADYLIGRTDSY